MIITGDCRTEMRKLIAEGVRVQMCVTSPPYFNLRDYGVENQIGMEKTLEEYVKNLVEVFRLVRDLLTDDGTLWLNLGDSYNGSGKDSGKQGRRTSQSIGNTPVGICPTTATNCPGLKPKDLIGIPWRVAFALQADGWWLRQDIIWHKPNPMPESVTDRCTKSHEYIFLLTKSARYFYDHKAIMEPVSEVSLKRSEYGWDCDRASTKNASMGGDGIHVEKMGTRFVNPEGRNKRSVWRVATKPYSGAHFACVDDETEALTPYGWKRHSSLCDGEEIAAYNYFDSSLQWESASFHRYDYDGEMVCIEKRDSSQRLTPNHRCLIKNRGDGIKVVLAETLKASMSVPVTAKLKVKEREAIGCELAALLGWYISEGEKRRYNTIRIYQSESANPEKVKEISDLLIACNAEFVERTRKRGDSIEKTFTISGHVMEFLSYYSPKKRINPEWCFWPDPEINAFLSAFIKGDGHVRKDGRMSIIQKNKEDIDVLQMMAIRLGYRAYISKRKDGAYSLYLTNGGWLTLRGTNGSHDKIGRVKYSGVVWCPSVPSTFWLARRQGKTFITGNTFPPALIEPCILAGSRVGDTVLDPFFGSGTTGMVSEKHGRNWIGIDLNPEYSKLAKRRTAQRNLIA